MTSYAAVVKLVDTGDSKSPAEMCDGSSPSRGTSVLAVVNANLSVAQS